MATASNSLVKNNDRKQIITGPSSQYIKLNIGGSLHYTTIATLTKHDSMLRSMFSGRLEVHTDEDGWVLIDRCGKHSSVILNFLRDDTVPLPDHKQNVEEIMAEAKFYCLQSLVDLCLSWLEIWTMNNEKNDTLPQLASVPVISKPKDEITLIQQTTRPLIKLSINRHNNKYSYTSQSDDNFLRNLELFDKLVSKFNNRVVFMKYVGPAQEVCSWQFFGDGQKVAEICCTSIVYATDKKHTKVDFPEAKIWEESINVLMYERPPVCEKCPHCRRANNKERVRTNAATLHAACCSRDEYAGSPPLPSDDEDDRGPQQVQDKGRKVLRGL